MALLCHGQGPWSPNEPTDKKTNIKKTEQKQKKQKPKNKKRKTHLLHFPL